MSYHAAPTRGRGGPSQGSGSRVRQEPPRMPEDRDATVSHGARRGGLGLPPLVLASSRGRGGRGGPPRGRGGPSRMTGSNSFARGVDSGWGASLPPRPPPPRPVDTYIPPRSPPAVHQRWDSPPEINYSPVPSESGPSNYAQNVPLPPSAPPVSSSRLPVNPPSSSTNGSSSGNAGATDKPVTIVPMKFKPKIPKGKMPIRPQEPSSSSVVVKEEVMTNGHSRNDVNGARIVHSKTNDGPSATARSTGGHEVIKDKAPVAGPSRAPARPPMDEKEDITAEEDVKPDISADTPDSGPSSAQRQDGGTIDESRNDGVLVMWPHQIPECFPPNKPPGRTKARQAWRSAREAELKVKGIRVIRALWRDDGVGLHWERAAQPRAKNKAESSTAASAREPRKPSPPARIPTPPRTASTTRVPVSPSSSGVSETNEKTEILVAPDPDSRWPKASKKSAAPSTPQSVKTKVKADVGSELSKSERKALRKKEKRKREAEEAEEASLNGQGTPIKKKKTKSERKKEKAARLEAETATAAPVDVKKEKVKDKSTSAKSASPPKPVKSEPGVSSSSIDRPKPKRLISITDAAPSSSEPMLKSSSFTPCPPPVPMRISAGPIPSPEPQPPRPIPTGPSRSSSTLPNPIRPYQGPTSIANPIRPYQAPSSTPQAPSQTVAFPSSRTSPPPSRPKPYTYPQSSSSFSTPDVPAKRPPPSVRPPPTGPRADVTAAARNASPVARPQVSRSITPSNVSSRYDELKRALSAKMVEMDNWTSMLTDMPDSAELTQRQIDRTRNACFDLQKQMREERDRTSGTT